MGFRTIVVATDFSRDAFAAMRRAALIAHACEAQLDVLHVVSAWSPTPAWSALGIPAADFQRDLLRSAEATLNGLAEQIRAEVPVQVRTRVATGKPAVAIADHAASTDADLIVVGAHGQNVVLTPLLGTTAHRVLTLAETPVLLVKRTPPLDDSAGQNYANVLIATAFSENCLEAARIARLIAPHARVSLFHAYEALFESKLSGVVSESAMGVYRDRALEEANARLDAFAKAGALTHAARVFRHGRPSLRIREYATEISADLIAVGSEEVTRLQHAVLGSVSLDVLTQAPCDVLLARLRSGARS